MGEIKQYLGRDVKRDREKGILRLTQSAYADELVTSFGLADAHPVKTPMDPGLVMDDSPDPNIKTKEYQRGVGSLIWLATRTRPDLSRTAGVLAQYNAAPTKKSWAALKHALRYIKGTIDLGVQYERDPNPEAAITLPIAYSDADWGGPLNGDRRSTSAYIFTLTKGPVSWRSQKQASIALSSNEAEYMAASETAREAIWIRNLMLDLGILGSETPPMKFKIDNKGVDDMTKKLEQRGDQKIEARRHQIPLCPRYDFEGHMYSMCSAFPARK